MTKQQILHQLKYVLKKHDSINHPAIIESIVNDIYNQILNETPDDKLRNMELYSKTYVVSISLDAASNRYYCTLPAGIVPLRKPADAIIAINATNGVGYRFYQTTEREVRLYDGSEAADTDQNYGYYLQNNKVWFTNYDAEMAAAGARLTLAVEFSEFAATDEVPLPSGKDYDIKQLVIDYIKQTNIIDLQNIRK